MTIRGILSIAILLATCSADVRPGGMAPIGQLFASADVVMAADTISVMQAATGGEPDAPSRGLVKVTVRPERIYKGALAAANAVITLPALGPSAPPAFVFSLGEHVLLFLDHTRTGGYVPADRFYSKFSVSQIRSPVPGTGPLGLQQDLLLGLRDADANTVLTHCFLLQGYDALTSLDAVRTLQTSADIRLRTCGYDLLIRNGDMAVLPDIVRFIGSPDSQNVPLTSAMILRSQLTSMRYTRQ